MAYIDYSWNPAYNMFLNIKTDYVAEFGVENLYDFGDGETCIEYWVSKLNDEEYAAMIAPLIFMQYNDFVLICYSLVESFGMESREEFWESYGGLYKECRSIVINYKRNEIALCPFEKFFNIGELNGMEMNDVVALLENAKSVEITDKLDGSRVSVRWYNGELLISGSKSLNPESAYRLGNYYKWINSMPNYIDMVRSHSAYTFIFEGIFPDSDPHIVHYGDEMIGLHLLGVRDVFTGSAFTYADVYSIAQKYGVMSVKPLAVSFDEMISQINADSKSAQEAEGFVIDIDGQKFKIKFNDYVEIHHIFGRISSKKVVLRAIQGDYLDDIYAKVPTALHKHIDETAKVIFKFIKMKEDNTKFYCNLVMAEKPETKKDFMSLSTKIVPSEYLGAVRNLYNGKRNDFLKGMRVYQIEEYIDGF